MLFIALKAARCAIQPLRLTNTGALEVIRLTIVSTVRESLLRVNKIIIEIETGHALITDHIHILARPTR
jgi:hypothetical protein